MGKISIILTSLLLTQVTLAAVESRNRVEELFIWKMSDEMKLSVPEEKAFSELIRNLNRKRSDSNEKLQEIIKGLASAKSTKDRERLLNDHRKALKMYNDISLEEVDQIQKLFGIDRSAQYFVFKNDLTNKLKALIATPEKKTSVPMAPPKVFEEK